MEESTLKYWKDAGHVARRTLEAMKLELTPGKTFHEVIESAERYIHRHGGKPAFPGTIAVNDLAAHFTTDHAVNQVEDWDGEMILQKGDCVKIDFGVHIKGHIADNALTFEIGNGNEHTEQIKAAKEARDAAIEMMHPGTPWYKVGQAAAQPSLMQASNPFATFAVTNSSHGNFMLVYPSHPTLAAQTIKGSKVLLKREASMLSSHSIQLDLLA